MVSIFGNNLCGYSFYNHEVNLVFFIFPGYYMSRDSYLVQITLVAVLRRERFWLYFIVTMFWTLNRFDFRAAAFGEGGH